MQTTFIQWKGKEPTLIRKEINGVKVKVKPNEIIEVPYQIAKDLSTSYTEIVIVDPQAEKEKAKESKKIQKETEKFCKMIDNRTFEQLEEMVNEVEKAVDVDGIDKEICENHIMKIYKEAIEKKKKIVDQTASTANGKIDDPEKEAKEKEKKVTNQKAPNATGKLNETKIQKS